MESHETNLIALWKATLDREGGSSRSDIALPAVNHIFALEEDE